MPTSSVSLRAAPVLAAAALAAAPAGAGLAATQAVGLTATSVLGAPGPGGTAMAGGAGGGDGGAFGGGGVSLLADGGNSTPVAAERSDAVSPVLSGAPRMPKHRWIGWVLAGLLLAGGLVLLLDYGGRHLGYFGGPAYTTVPFVNGESVQQAEIKLARAQLNFKASPVTASSERAL